MGVEAGCTGLSPCSVRQSLQHTAWTEYDEGEHAIVLWPADLQKFYKWASPPMLGFPKAKSLSAGLRSSAGLLG